MSAPRVYEIATAEAPAAAVGRLTFVPAGGDDPFAGETRYEVLRPSGEGWMLVVQEFLTGPEVHVFLGPERREGPHDRDLRQLEGALRLVPHNFPVLRVLGLADRPPAQQARDADPAVEAVKSLVRERLVAAVAARPAGAGRDALGDTVRRALEPVARARDELGLATGLGQLQEVIERSRDAEGLLDLVDDAMHRLDRDADDPALSPALRNAVRQYWTWRIERPPIVH